MKKGRYFILFVSLLTIFVVNPFFQERILGVSLLEILLLVILLSSISVVIDRKQILVIATIIVIAAFGTKVAVLITGNDGLHVVSLALYVLFIAIITVIILAHVLADDAITADKIFGACIVYLFLGLMWGMVYTAMETIQPGSFFDNRPMEVAEDLSQPGNSSLIYYSFVTLSTLGYGDITPASAPARSFATLEAIMGQLYVAILIARLVALHITHSLKKR